MTDTNNLARSGGDIENVHVMFRDNKLRRAEFPADRSFRHPASDRSTRSIYPHSFVVDQNFPSKSSERIRARTRQRDIKNYSELPRAMISPSVGKIVDVKPSCSRNCAE